MANLEMNIFSSFICSKAFGCVLSVLGIQGLKTKPEAAVTVLPAEGGAECWCYPGHDELGKGITVQDSQRKPVGRLRSRRTRVVWS